MTFNPVFDELRQISISYLKKNGFLRGYRSDYIRWYRADRLTGTVALTCTGAPAFSTCTLSPAGVTLAANGTATSSGTVTTTRPALAPPPPMFRTPPHLPVWLWGLLILVVAFLAVWTTTRQPVRKLAFGFGLLSLLALAGCTLHRHTPGTPTGTFSLSVKGTSGSLSHTASYSLIVN